MSEEVHTTNLSNNEINNFINVYLFSQAMEICIQVVFTTRSLTFLSDRPQNQSRLYIFDIQVHSRALDES